MTSTQCIYVTDSAKENHPLSKTQDRGGERKNWKVIIQFYLWD